MKGPVLCPLSLPILRQSCSCFAMLVVEGVQVFPGVDTLQAMELNPLAEGDNSLTTTDVREIPEQTL